VALALLLGIPTLRLRADYFAITTIAVAEILRLLVRSGPGRDLTGRSFGLQGIAVSSTALNPIPRGPTASASLSFPHHQLWVLLVTWAVAILATLLLVAHAQPVGAGAQVDP
jgi:neutral amino acid transport system permease protein